MQKWLRMMARMVTWSKAGSEYIYINMKMPSLRDHLLMQINGILYIKFDNELWYEWSFDKLIIEAKAEYGLNTIPGIISFDKIIPVRIDNWMILSKHKQEEVISKLDFVILQSLSLKSRNFSRLNSKWDSNPQIQSPLDQKPRDYRATADRDFLHYK